MHRPDLLRRIGSGLAVALLFGCEPTPGLEVTDAWVRPPLPGKTVAAGYFTLHNNTDRVVTLVSMTSPIASRVELHTHYLEGDMMRMRKLDELEVASRRQVVLASGGEHLMLFNVGVLSGPVRMALEFADGTVINTQLDIRDLTP